MSTYSNFLRLPEPDQNIQYLSCYPLVSTKFRKNIEIPWKLANSTGRLKILGSAENCGP